MMRKSASPVDLAALFGLSEEEALSLGLEQQESAMPATRDNRAADHLAIVDGSADAKEPVVIAPEEELPECAEHLPPQALATRSSEPQPADASASAFAQAPVDGAPSRMPAEAQASASLVATPATADSPLPSMASELLTIFMEEAAELLDDLHTVLEALERTPSASGIVEARRAVHTIKGGARMCGLTGLADLAHACEDLIALSTVGDPDMPAAHLAALFDAEQAMRAALVRPGTGSGAEASAPAVTARLRALAAKHAQSARDQVAAATTLLRAERPSAAMEPSPPTDTPQRAVATPLLRRPVIESVAPHAQRISVDLQKVEDLVAKVTEIVANRAAGHGMMELLSATVLDSMRTVQRLQSIAAQLQYQVVTHGLDATAAADPDGLGLETYGPIRQLLLQLQEAAGDQQAQVQAAMDLVTNRRALAAVETRLDTELQGALLNMRLMPISQLRVRLDQVVRSTAAAARRDVRWTMEGQHVALDKQVCDRLFEPLMHVLRNAIDHGIEPPEERERLGKPRIGRIVVQALVSGNQATVSVSDDGRGVDPAHLAGVAVARGVITAEQAAHLSDRDKLELIFRPGFTTASTVTDLSGRGMGMEIVREACTRMGGSVTISPRAGGGTVVTLGVPLSLSVAHALVVRDNGRVQAIPASQVFSVHLVRAVAVVARDGGSAVRIGREEIPLYRLPSSTARASGSQFGADEEFSVVVLPHRGGRIALAVDEIVNEEDLIVKPAPILLQGLDQLLGTVILADGTPAPVLNMPPLLDQIVRPAGPSPRQESVAPSTQMVLVVDDSLTMRMALAQTLKHAGYTVLAARDGMEALDLIREHGMPRLITLDIEMPRMDGLETLYAIRNTPGAERVPIFMLTSRSGQKHQRTAMSLGATRYFTKPYHDREFVRAVREATPVPAR